MTCHLRQLISLLLLIRGWKTTIGQFVPPLCRLLFHTIAQTQGFDYLGGDWRILMTLEMSMIINPNRTLYPLSADTKGRASLGSYIANNSMTDYINFY